MYSPAHINKGLDNMFTSHDVREYVVAFKDVHAEASPYWNVLILVGMADMKKDYRVLHFLWNFHCAILIALHY